MQRNSPLKVCNKKRMDCVTFFIYSSKSKTIVTCALHYQSTLPSNRFDTPSLWLAEPAHSGVDLFHIEPRRGKQSQNVTHNNDHCNRAMIIIKRNQDCDVNRLKTQRLERNDVLTYLKCASEHVANSFVGFPRAEERWFLWVAGVSGSASYFE